MRNSFNLLLIVLAWFDIFFIIIAVLDYSVARGNIFLTLFGVHIYNLYFIFTVSWWFHKFQIMHFQCSSGLLIWRANYMFTCSHASSIPSTTSFSGWHFILVKKIVFHKEFQICVIKWNTFYIKNIFQHLNIPHCCRRLRKVKIFFFTF